MNLKKLPNTVLLLLSVCLLVIGIALITWLIGNMPSSNAASEISNAAASTIGNEPANDNLAPTGHAAENSDSSAGVAERATPTATISSPVELTIGLTTVLPSTLFTDTQLLETHKVISGYSPGKTSNSAVALSFDLDKTDAAFTYRYTFAAATRFDTIDPEISWQDLSALWRQSAADAPADTSAVPYTQIAVLTDTLPILSTILGQAGPDVIGYATSSEVVDAGWQDVPTLVLIPFDLLVPRLAVLAIDGQKPIENANKFDEATYPFVGTIYGHITTDDPATKSAAETLLATLPTGNRDASRLTVIAMTGVTAMVRLTAAEMDKRGYGWPAAVVGPELASADITAISNEVPFVPGCETDTRMDNLTFCSKPEYMEALSDSGVDIIGLTGNHQNDFGRDDAVTSLDIYEQAGLPVYGGGRNKEEAFAPLYLEHNGNQLAFLGANSYGPTFAWATDDEPGSAEFDLNIMSATIRNIKEQGRAKVVLAELQYQESYDVIPLLDQRQNFNALNRAGADIVTGVQSHVPQAMEFTDGKLILYGLGNLYFDQMWSQTTREGMIVKHTIYNNRHISTQILTTLLYDYGQPQWTTTEENRAILDRVFGASYW